MKLYTSCDKTQIDNYSVYKPDHSYLAITKNRGGGVLILLSNDFSSRCLATMTDNFQHVSVLINCAELLILGCVFLNHKSLITE